MIDVVEALVETLDHFGLIYFYFPVEGVGKKDEGGKKEEEGEKRKEEGKKSIDEQKRRKGEDDGDKEGWRREEEGKKKEEEGKRAEEGRKKEDEKEEEEGRRKEGRLKLEVGGFFKAVIEMIFDILVQSKDDETIVRMTKLLVKYTLGEVKPINLGHEMLKSKKRNEKYFVNISCLGLDQIPPSYPSQESLSIQGVILILKNIFTVMKTKNKDEAKKSKGKPSTPFPSQYPYPIPNLTLPQPQPLPFLTLPILYPPFSLKFNIF